MERPRYERTCLNILKNVDWYKVVPPSFVDDLSTRYHTIINKAYNDGVISKEIWEFLQVPNPKLVTFYALPKTQKKLFWSTRMPDRL